MTVDVIHDELWMITVRSMMIMMMDDIDEVDDGDNDG